jgi:hypothetical protein
MKIPADKLQKIDTNKYKALSEKTYEETDDDLYKSLWELNKLVSKEEYEYFLEFLVSLSGPIYLPVYIGVFEEFISCFNELLSTGLFIDDSDLHLTVKLLKLFNKITAEKLKKEFALNTKIITNPLNNKFSNYPFFSSLTQPYDDSVPKASNK